MSFTRTSKPSGKPSSVRRWDPRTWEEGRRERLVEGSAVLVGATAGFVVKRTVVVVGLVFALVGPLTFVVLRAAGRGRVPTAATAAVIVTAAEVAAIVVAVAYVSRRTGHR